MIKIWIALIAFSGVLVFQHSQDLNLRNTHTLTKLTENLPSRYNDRHLEAAVEKVTKKDTIFTIAVNQLSDSNIRFETP